MIDLCDMGKCSTCKYWSKNPPQRGWHRSDGVYRFVINPLMGACTHPKLVDGGFIDDPASDSLVYSGAYGYEADLEVGPDFGCRHHEERDYD